MTTEEASIEPAAETVKPSEIPFAEVKKTSERVYSALTEYQTAIERLARAWHDVDAHAAKLREALADEEEALKKIV